MRGSRAKALRQANPSRPNPGRRYGGDRGTNNESSGFGRKVSRRMGRRSRLHIRLNPRKWKAKKHGSS